MQADVSLVSFRADGERTLGQETQVDTLYWLTGFRFIVSYLLPTLRICSTFSNAARSPLHVERGT
jgi:hypothetical protein